MIVFELKKKKYVGDRNFIDKRRYKYFGNLFFILDFLVIIKMWGIVFMCFKDIYEI